MYILMKSVNGEMYLIGKDKTKDKIDNLLYNNFCKELENYAIDTAYIHSCEDNNEIIDKDKNKNFILSKKEGWGWLKTPPNFLTFWEIFEV